MGCKLLLSGRRDALLRATGWLLGGGTGCYRLVPLAGGMLGCRRAACLPAPAP